MAGSSSKKWLWISLGVTALFIVGIISTMSEQAEQQEAREQYLASLTPEQRDSLRLYEDSVAAERERQKADKPLQGLESTAYVLAKEHVAAMLKYPKTADFPLEPTYEQYYLGGIYDLRGTVEAKNAFGVPSEHVWSVRAIYNGGDKYANSSWNIEVKELR